MARKNPLQGMTREEADETIRRLPDMNTARLTDLWAALFGTVCYTRRRAFIIRRLEWRINTLMSGGISERALKRAEEIADDTLLLVKCRAFKSRKPAGNKQPDKHAAGKKKVITKVYKGVEYRVYPDKGGCFLYDGTRYNTLSEVSTRIAGYYVSGTKFFGIRKSDIA